MEYKTNWHYESDGDPWAKTHYVWRWNDKAPLGVERIDFKTKQKALKFIKGVNHEKALRDSVSR